MATTKKNGTEDLLGQLGDEKPGEVVDLLDAIDESGASPWIAENSGDGVQGIVTSVSTMPSDYSDKPVPVIEVKDAAGQEWSIRGYASVLQSEIEKADPQPGDTFAVKYFGKKEGKGGNSYHHYKVAIRKAAIPARAAANGAPF